MFLQGLQLAVLIVTNNHTRDILNYIFLLHPGYGYVHMSIHIIKHDYTSVVLAPPAELPHQVKVHIYLELSESIKSHPSQPVLLYLGYVGACTCICCLKSPELKSHVHSYVNLMNRCLYCEYMYMHVMCVTCMYIVVVISGLSLPVQTANRICIHLHFTDT